MRNWRRGGRRGSAWHGSFGRGVSCVGAHVQWGQGLRQRPIVAAVMAHCDSDVARHPDCEEIKARATELVYFLLWFNEEGNAAMRHAYAYVQAQGGLEGDDENLPGEEPQAAVPPKKPNPFYTSDKQRAFLNKLGVTKVPLSSKKASALISERLAELNAGKQK